MFYLDDPISKPKEDRLGRRDFVNQLAKSIISWRSSQSVVLALYGSWGSGKSSVLNLLEQKLSSSKRKLALARFDPWFFNSPEQLLRGFWDTFARNSETILGKGAKRSRALTDLIRRYSGSLSFTPEVHLPLMGSLKVPLKFGSNLEAPERVKADIEKLLAQADGKIIFLIDNLDRLDAQELTLVLKLIRLCSDLPNTIYVLAFDKLQVENILTEKKDIDKEYLDKIVQVDIHLPSIDSAQIEALLIEGLNRVLNNYKVQLEENFSERFWPLFQKEVLPKLLTDIRKTKRYLNGVSFSLPLVIGEVNYSDLFQLEVLRIFIPSLYNLIPSFKYCLVPSGDAFFAKGELINGYQALANEIENLPRDSELAKNILRNLFPYFHSYLSNPTDQSYLAHGYIGSEVDKELRIASSRHFDKYFRLQVPSKEVPMTVLRAEINRINSAAESGNFEQIDNIILDLQAGGTLMSFLGRFSVFISEFSAGGKEALMRQLVMHSDRYSWQPYGIWGFAEIRNLVIFINACLRGESLEKTVNLTEFVVKETPSLAFACYYCSTILEGVDSNSEQRGKLLSLLHERINNELVKKRANVFEVYPDYFQGILSIWSSPNHINKKTEADTYRDDLLQKQPEYIPRVLREFLSNRYSSATSKPRPALRYEDLKKAYDVARLYKILKETSIETVSDEIEDILLKEFFRSFEIENSVDNGAT